MKLLLALLLLFVPAWATDYYVDNTCMNNGLGTTTTCGAGGGSGPFNSLANAQTGLTGDQHDNRLLFHTGQTFSGQYTCVAWGTSGHPFTITNYGGGAKPIVTGGASNFNFSDTNCHYVVLDGFEATSATTTAAIYVVQPAGDITIQNNDAHATNGRGIFIYHASNNTIDSNEVRQVTGSGVGGANAIEIRKDNASYATSGNIVSNNLVHNNIYYGIAITGISSSRLDGSTTKVFGNTSYNNSTGTYLIMADGVEVYNNTFHDNGKDCISTNDCLGEPYGYASQSCSNTSVHDNLIYNSYTTGMGIYGDNGSTSGRGNSNLIFRNIVYGTVQGSWKIDIFFQTNSGDYVGSGNVVYNNITLMATSAGASNINLALGDDALSATANFAYNNTLVGGDNAIRFTGNASPASWTLKNNLMSICATQCLFAFNVTTGVTALDNLYYKAGGGNLASNNNVNYTSGTISGFDSMAVTTDPLFTSTAAWTGLTLQTGSPAIDVGVNLGSPYNLAANPTDTTWPLTVANQDSYGAGWELGAFVYGSITNAGGTQTSGKSTVGGKVATQ